MIAPRHRSLETNTPLLRYAALILLVLALPLCAIALGTAAGLLPLPYPLWLVEQRLGMLFRMHMASAGLALVVVPIAIACHGFSLHKLVGRTAAILVLVGGVTAVPAALASQSHWIARAGFLAQAVVWITLVPIAVRAVREGDVKRHKWLMLAVAAIASGALWLRLATWAAASRAASFEAIYALASWLSWTVPLGVVGLLAAANRRRRAVAGSVSARACQSQPHAAADEEAAAEPRDEADAVAGEEAAGAA